MPDATTLVGLGGEGKPLKVVVAGGGTVAPIDDVRFIANFSTGRFAAEITEACLARGATVWHIHTPSALVPFRRDAVFDLEGPDPAAEHQRLDALLRRWTAARDRLHLVGLARGMVDEYAANLEATLRREAVDVVFSVIAVSDFAPSILEGKLDSSRGPLTMELSPTPKIIRRIRDWSPGVYLVGFKLLVGSTREALLDAAGRGNITNRADLTVANDLRDIQAGRHTIHLVRPGQPVETIGPGGPLAELLVERVWSWARERS